MKTVFYNFFLYVILLCVFPTFSHGQCNVQASLCTMGTSSPSYDFIGTNGGAYAGGAFVNAGCSTGQFGNQSYGFIILYIDQGGLLNLLINANTSSGFIDVAIFNIPAGVAPCTAIQNGANAIGCNFASQSGGCVQFGTSFPCGSSVPAPAVNAGDVIMIIAQNYSTPFWPWETGNTTFNVSLSTSSNTATVSLPNPTITSTEFCWTEPNPVLTAVDNGGQWSGMSGLNANGTFNPSVAGAGVHTVNYTIGAGECQTSDTAQITIRGISMSDNAGSTISLSSCGVSGIYSLSGAVHIVSPPTSGDLVVVHCSGDTTILASAPFTNAAYPFSFSGLDANAGPCFVQTYFTDFPCSEQYNYTPPECTSCEFSNTTIELSSCHADNTFDLSGLIEFDAEPPTGQLFIVHDNGDTIIFNAPFTSPHSFSFSNIFADGGTHTISAYFSDDVCTSFFEYTALSIPKVVASDSVRICQGDSTTISANGATTYSWDNNLGANQTQIVSPHQHTTYTVTGYSSQGCWASDSVTVWVNSVPKIDFSVTQDQACLPVTATFHNHTTGDIQSCLWIWSDNNTTTSCDSTTYIFDKPGIYGASLQVVSNDNCTVILKKDSILYIAPLPLAAFSASPSVFELNDSHVDFVNLSTGATIYNWDFGDGGAFSTDESPYYIYPSEEANSYVVELIASSDAGCSDTVQGIVRGEEGLIFYIPNTFTPNGDDYNAVFSPFMTSGFDPYKYHLRIYDRWGEEIFYTDDITHGWDGTNASNKTGDDTYIWHVELKMKKTDERKVFHGHVNLIR